jgi:hypothetical protein
MQHLERVDGADARYYRFRTPEGDVVEYPSVTTTLQIINKPYLIPWAVKLCAQHLQDNCPVGTVLTQEALDGVVAIGSKEHQRILKDACEFGTRAHHLMEQRIVTGSFPNLTGEEHRVIACCDRFEQWWERQSFEVSANEMVIYSRTYRYAGTLDCLAYDREGNLHLIDFKTSNYYDTSYALQAVAYAQAYEETYGGTIDRIVVVRVGREDAELELVPIAQEDRAMLFETFLSAYRLWTWKRDYKHSKRAAAAAIGMAPARTVRGISRAAESRMLSGI